MASRAANSYDPARELVDVIDDEGRVLRVATRAEMRAQKLPHRCTYVLVFNRAGELFVHLRTPGKDVYPSYWDACIGGVVTAGESFAQGVHRELAEEIGVEAEVEELFPFRYADERSSLQGIVYQTVHDGPFRLQPEEIVLGEFVPLARIEDLARERPFCPDSLEVLAELKRRRPQAFAPWPGNVRILLGSGGLRTPERIRFFADEMRDFFGPVDRLLFIPYAQADYDGNVQSMQNKGIAAGYPLDGIHRHADPQKAIRQAPALFIGGGNTFRLLATMYRFGLLEVIRERVREGMPYLGISAGTNVACPTIKTTNDMPIIQPPSLDALNLVPFQINPHYFQGSIVVRHEGALIDHFGETRDDRIREFHQLNDTPVLGLWEGGLVRLTEGKAQLRGAAARWFFKDRPAVDLSPGMAVARM